jgi:hypothetical protein
MDSDLASPNDAQMICKAAITGRPALGVAVASWQRTGPNQSITLSARGCHITGSTTLREMKAFLPDPILACRQRSMGRST